MKIGVFFNARREQGGLFQYALSAAHSLASFGGGHDIVVYDATGSALPQLLKTPSIKFVHIPKIQIAPRQALEMLTMIAARSGWRGRMRILPEFPSVRENAPDIMLYVKPGIHSFLWPYPAAFPVHDLQHLFQPQFPEVSALGEASRREYVYRNAIPRAAAVLADSPMGRDDLARIYGAPPERVHSLPHLAPSYLARAATQEDISRVGRRYSLPEGYFFYPAAFWRHKNHECILRALRVILDTGIHSPVVAFAGSLTRRYREVASLARSLGVSNCVRFLGYVPDEDIPALYVQAGALVMPTFFGYTNTPCLEAWAYGCPVITSTARGIPEHVGEAAVVVDPRDHVSLAGAMLSVREDSALREQLVRSGKAIVENWTPQDFAAKLIGIMERSVP